MMMKFDFHCDGRYEAEKLAALVSVQKDGTVYVAGVTTVVGNEVVIKLKDKSSHSVVLKDSKNAEKLHALLEKIASGKVTIISSDSAGDVAEIVVSE